MEFEQAWGISFDRAATQLDEQLTVTRDGHVQCCVALSASFYVRDGHTLEVRQRIVDCFELYRERVGDVLVWGGDPKTAKAKKVRNTSILDVASWMPRVSPEDAFEPAFSGGSKSNDASPYRFSALARSPDPDDLSAITFSVPLSWAATREQGAYLEAILRAASILRPVHGYAGLAVVLSLVESGSGSDTEPAAALVKRFRGLDLDFAELQTESLKTAIKGVGWLTILGDTFVEQLGGSAGLVATLGSNIPVHAYPGGVVIQAGPHPRFGDVNRAEPMEDYERVAAVLKPIRTTKLRRLSTLYGLDADRTARWLERFDKE
ncbi:MAG: hypothetical protein RLZZ450_7073 [Pseudomonadota bacterium]